MKKNDISGLARKVLLEEAWTHWSEGAAHMMTATTTMQALTLADREELRDLLTRLAAIVTQGATILEKKPNVDFERFMEGLVELGDELSSKMGQALEPSAKTDLCSIDDF